MTARVLITGATGFVGYHLTAALVQQRREVHVVVRAASKQERLSNLCGDITLHIHDGSTAGMIELMERASPETVFHLASLFLAEHKSSDVERLIQSNILFGTQLVEAVVQCEVPRLVNTGTSWQHFRNSDYNPVSLYAATKQAFEDLLRFYTDAYPLRAITLKLFDTYGPRDPRNKLFALLRKCSEEGVPLAMSPGQQLLDLVYIDDAVRAFLRAEELLISNALGKGVPSFAVSSGQHVSLRELVTTFERVTARPVPIEWGGRAYRAREVMVPWAGPSLPGWEPLVDLEAGIRKMQELV